MAIDRVAAAATCLWIYWGLDEVVRGVNPWRRILGPAVLVWQVSRAIGSRWRCDENAEHVGSIGVKRRGW